MTYRIPLPRPSDDRPELVVDLVDGVTTAEQVAIRTEGLAQFHPATTAWLLAAAERQPRGFTYVDIDAGIGVFGAMLQLLLDPGVVIAEVDDPVDRDTHERVAQANELSTSLVDDAALSATAADLIRIGPRVDTLAVLARLWPLVQRYRPTLVIEDSEVDVERQHEIAARLWAAGYHLYPARRYGRLRRLQDGDPRTSSDWLCSPVRLGRNLRPRALQWAGALGACGPDRNPGLPRTASLRAVLGRRPRSIHELAQSVREDLRRARIDARRRMRTWRR